MRWSMYDRAVNAAHMVAKDGDIARDAALQALEECGDAPDGHILRRARDRAKDLVRSNERQPQVLHQDMDLLPADDSVIETVARRQHDDKMLAALGSRSTYILRAVAEGFTNADIGRVLGVSEETARLWRNEAQLQRDIQGL